MTKEQTTRYQRFGEKFAAFRAQLLEGAAAGFASDLAVCPLCVKFGCTQPVVKQGRWSGKWFLTAGGLGCHHANAPEFSKPELTRSTVVAKWNAWCQRAMVGTGSTTSQTDLIADEPIGFPSPPQDGCPNLGQRSALSGANSPAGKVSDGVEPVPTVFQLEGGA